jgi:hypothetical protein
MVGAEKRVAPGIYDLFWAGAHGLAPLANDQLSSLDVPSGYTVKLFPDQGLTGSPVTYTSGSYSGVGAFNDQMSSVYVTRNGESGTFFLKLKRDWIEKNGASEAVNGRTRVYGNHRYVDSQAKSTTFNPAATQEWRYDIATRAIVNVQTGQCLDVAGGNLAVETPVTPYWCHGGANQQWSILWGGEIQTPNGLCLGIAHGHTPMEIGAPLEVSTCLGPEYGDRQQWELMYQCRHDPCTPSGGPLTAACSPDVADVCAGDPWCCQSGWDAQCVSEMPTKCQ